MARSYAQKYRQTIKSSLCSVNIDIWQRNMSTEIYGRDVAAIGKEQQ